jgi:hypothetical protein
MPTYRGAFVEEATYFFAVVTYKPAADLDERTAEILKGTESAERGARIIQTSQVFQNQ